MTNLDATIATKRSLRGKIPQILLLIIILIIVIILANTLESILVEGHIFAETPIATFLNGFLIFAEDVEITVKSWGYSGIFFLMVLDSLPLPVPGEVVLPFAGYLVSQGALDFWLVIIISTLAGMVGSLINYYIGLKGTSFLSKRKTIQHLLYDQGRMQTVERWFNKHGAPTIFLCRLIPGFRSVISLPAGAVRMSLTKFIVYTTAGCLVWNTILISIGVYVGANWRRVTSILQYLIIAVVAAAVIVFVLWLIRRRKTQATKRKK